MVIERLCIATEWRYIALNDKYIKLSSLTAFVIKQRTMGVISKCWLGGRPSHIEPSQTMGCMTEIISLHKSYCECAARVWNSTSRCGLLHVMYWVRVSLCRWIIQELADLLSIWGWISKIFALKSYKIRYLWKLRVVVDTKNNVRPVAGTRHTF